MLSKVASNKLVVLARFVSMLWDTRAAMVDAGSAQIPQHDLGQELPSIAIMFIKASVAWQVLCFASRHTDGFKINRNKIHITILLHCRTCSFKTLKLICYSFTCILTVSGMRLLPRTHKLGLIHQARHQCVPFAQRTTFPVWKWNDSIHLSMYTSWG